MNVILKPYEIRIIIIIIIARVRVIGGLFAKVICHLLSKLLISNARSEACRGGRISRIKKKKKSKLLFTCGSLARCYRKGGKYGEKKCPRTSYVVVCTMSKKRAATLIKTRARVRGKSAASALIEIGEGPVVVAVVVFHSGGLAPYCTHSAFIAGRAYA